MPQAAILLMEGISNSKPKIISKRPLRNITKSWNGTQDGMMGR